MPSKNYPEVILRVKNIRIGERKADKMHDDEFTVSLHLLANQKIAARRIYPAWYESKNHFLHEDWVEVIRKN